MQFPLQYFKNDENWETIRTGHHVDTKRRENKEDRTYSKNLQVRDFIYSEEWVRYEYLATGAEYVGQWLGGMRHGEGKMQWPDGASYSGTWRCNQASRYGKFIYHNGDIYEGGWASNLMCGYGVYRHANGNIYRGQWL